MTEPKTVQSLSVSPSRGRAYSRHHARRAATYAVVPAIAIPDGDASLMGQVTRGLV
ncbi:hypothetical protein AB0K18_45360 [Nonomuraea sp. NPDC049421]|uniref:hypothetical protein n=1 Tax=Nonomuraea sp. NPDC049421 TaxID=3155275 RepID=UPI00343DD2E7